MTCSRVIGHSILVTTCFQGAALSSRSSPPAGLAGYVQRVFLDGLFIDNANLLRAPGHAIVKLYLHYMTAFTGYAKRPNLRHSIQEYVP